MAAKKRVTISYKDDNGNDHVVQLVNVTSFEQDEETSANVTPTFDGPLTEGNDDNPWSITIERSVYDKRTKYIEIRDMIKALHKIKGLITLEEDYYISGETPFTIIKNFSGAVIDGNSHKVDPEKHSVSNLKFKCENMEELDPQDIT